MQIILPLLPWIGIYELKDGSVVKVAVVNLVDSPELQ